MSDPEPSYWERVRNRAAELGSDGCTMGTRLFRLCCLEHDIHQRDEHTLDGEPISWAEADARFLACMQRKSWFGWWSPVAWTRYAFVRLRTRIKKGE